jgi:GntR family transcriptional regulator/MocR family aminotransferase
MKRTATTFIPPVAIDFSSRTPMHRQLYDWFRSAILDGRISPGHRVPSTRGLAAELKISRMPVVNAFDQLLTEKMGVFQEVR